MIDVPRIVRRLTAPLYRRVMLMVSRLVVNVVHDSLKLQEVQIGLLDDETRDGVERFQNYGMTSVPLPGAEGVCVFVGGNRDHGLILAVDDRRYRIQGLEGGEVALYTDENLAPDGHRIVLKRNNLIEVHCKDAEVHAANDATINAGRDAKCIAQSLARLEGDVVKIHAAHMLQMDVNGFGEQWIWDDSNWYADTWMTDPRVIPGSPHNIVEPEIP